MDPKYSRRMACAAWICRKSKTSSPCQEIHPVQEKKHHLKAAKTKVHEPSQASWTNDTWAWKRQVLCAHLTRYMSFLPGVQYRIGCRQTGLSPHAPRGDRGRWEEGRSGILWTPAATGATHERWRSPDGASPWCLLVLAADPDSGPFWNKGRHFTASRIWCPKMHSESLIEYFLGDVHKGKSWGCHLWSQDVSLARWLPGWAPVCQNPKELSLSWHFSTAGCYGWQLREEGNIKSNQHKSTIQRLKRVPCLLRQHLWNDLNYKDARFDSVWGGKSYNKSIFATKGRIGFAIANSCVTPARWHLCCHMSYGFCFDQTNCVMVCDGQHSGGFFSSIFIGRCAIFGASGPSGFFIRCTPPLCTGAGGTTTPTSFRVKQTWFGVQGEEIRCTTWTPPTRSEFFPRSFEKQVASTWVCGTGSLDMFFVCPIL